MFVHRVSSEVSLDHEATNVISCSHQLGQQSVVHSSQHRKYRIDRYRSCYCCDGDVETMRRGSARLPCFYAEVRPSYKSGDCSKSNGVSFLADFFTIYSCTSVAGIQ